MVRRGGKWNGEKRGHTRALLPPAVALRCTHKSWSGACGLEIIIRQATNLHPRAQENDASDTHVRET